jgi:ADP-heptose:LPS heptosyltransferase
MALIQKPNTDKLTPGTRTTIDSMEIPSFRFLLGQQERTLKNILIRTPQALGDCVCAEPAIRYAQKHFKDSEVSLVTPWPDLFRHIPSIKKVYFGSVQPDWDKYYVLECYHAADALQSDFVHNFNMAIEDYISVSLFKGMMPVKDRNIILKPNDIERASVGPSQQVVIHAGRHWISKTFPKKWWDGIIQAFVAKGIKPALVGAKIAGSNRGYVDVDANHCLDFRDKLTVMQSVALLQNAQVVLTNDSAPYHMACSSDGERIEGPWVGVFSTVRHFDFIGHWRPGRGPWDQLTNVWNSKIENLAKGQMWQDTDITPGRNGAKYDVIDHTTLMTWLPEPEEAAHWALTRVLGGRA